MRGERIDIAQHALLCSTLHRLAGRIGLSRIPKPIPSPLDQGAGWTARSAIRGVGPVPASCSGGPAKPVGRPSARFMKFAGPPQGHIWATSGAGWALGVALSLAPLYTYTIAARWHLAFMEPHAA